MRPAPVAEKEAYLAFVREQVRLLQLARPVEPPATEAGWQRRLKSVREGLMRSVGRVPETACDLAPEVLGTVKGDGFVVERLTFQSRPGVRVTANLYRADDLKGPAPAVLCVHGHWAWARMDPNVQPRCIGLAKMGYVVLVVDAFGAGERAIVPKSGTYHGALDGASLWPTGVSLLGLQVYDNRRAVDYLLTRPEVDGKKLAITGASGGGNQSLYAGALDDRFTAVVPVCGVGTYDAYLGSACCICEMNNGGMTYATTGDLLAMIAPRALLVINATKDAIQFSVAEAAKSIAFARHRFQTLGVNDKLHHVPIESGHAYNQPMREAMYGWLDRWLRNKGDGSPVPEPEHKVFEPQQLRCYPDATSRPKSIITIPEFALREGQAQLAALPQAPDHAERWEAESLYIKSQLRPLISGPLKRAEPETPAKLKSEAAGKLVLQTEPGVELQGRRVGTSGSGKVTLLIRQDGQAEDSDPTLKALIESGRQVVTVDVRATGRLKPETGAVHHVTDHNEAEWALWIGWPLIYQWTRDALQWIDATGASEVIGVGPFGLVGLLAAAFRRDHVERTGLISPLVSFVAPDITPWAGVPMGIIAPNILALADIGRLASLVAPGKLVIAGGVEPTGVQASNSRLGSCFAHTRAVFNMLKMSSQLVVLPQAEVAALTKALDAE